MASASNSVTLWSNGGHGYTLNASFWENSTSTANNTSNITCKATLTSQGAAWSSSYNSTLTIYWHDNRENYDRYVASINLSSLGVNASAAAQGTINVTHKDDGSLSGYAYAYFTKGGTSSYTPNSGGVTNNWTALTKIARNPTITSAPNFTDRDNPTMYFTTNTMPNATYNACISLTGAKDDVPYRQINISSGNYTFNLTPEDRKVLRGNTPAGSSKNVMFFLRTDSGGQSYYSTMTKTMTVVRRPVKIMRNGSWVNSFPYVRVNGQWKEAKTYIRNNGSWKEEK